MDTTETEEKVDEHDLSFGEPILERVKEEDEEMEAEVKIEGSEADKEQSPIQNMDVETQDLKEEKDLKPTDDNDNNVEVKQEETGEVENLVEESKEDDSGSANNSLVADGAESGANSLSAPVVAQQKVVITEQLVELPELKVQFYCSQPVTQQIYCGTCVLKVYTCAWQSEFLVINRNRKILMWAGATWSSSEVLGSPELPEVDPWSQMVCT